MTTETIEISSIIYAEHAAGTESAEGIPAEQWDALGEQTCEALLAAYPGASVKVSVEHGVSGHGAGTTYRVNGEKDDERSADCKAIAERAWERWCATMPAESPEQLFDRALSRTSLGPRNFMSLDEYANAPSDDEATRAHYSEAVKAARRGEYDECHAALVEAARAAGV